MQKGRSPETANGPERDPGNGRKLFFHQFAGIVRFVFPFGHRGQFAFQQSSAQRRHVVDEQFAVQVVVLVLDDPRRETFELLVVLDEIFVRVADPDPRPVR